MHIDENNNTPYYNGLPFNINEAVPEAMDGAQSITKLVKDSGAVVGYELSSGEVLSKEQAVEKAKQGKIKGVAVAVSGKGEEYLRTLPDGTEDNNLNNLPSISRDEEEEIF